MYQHSNSMNITRCMCVHLVDQRGACILVNPGYSKDVLMDIEKAEVILATLHQHNLTIRQFLRIVLDSCNEDKLKSSSHSALSAFLQGWTVTGTWPINTVKLMFHHHLSQDGLRVGLTYHQLPIYAWPPMIPSLHPQSHFSSLDAMLDGIGPCNFGIH